jgi:hypothetical protein
MALHSLDGATPGSLLPPSAPEHSHVLQKREKAAQTLRRLQAAGLQNHVAQALWRTATAGDATFVARMVGLPDEVAQQLDEITTGLWAEWLEMTDLPDNAKARLWQPLREGGMGYTAATHLQGTALVASWKQVLPFILKATNVESTTALFQQTPNIAKQIKDATTLLHESVWQDMLAIQQTNTPERHTQKTLASLSKAARQTTPTSNTFRRRNGNHALSRRTGSGRLAPHPRQRPRPTNQ